MSNKNVNWINKDSLVVQEILEEINSCEIKINDDGKVSFSGNAAVTLFLGLFQSSLADNLEFKQKIASRDKSSLIMEAISDSAKKQFPISKDLLLNEIKKKVKNLNKIPEKEFIFLQQINLSCKVNINQVKLNNYISFKFLKKLPNKWEGCVHQKKHKDFFNPLLLPENCQWVKSTIKSKNVSTAFEIADDNLFFLIGMWNLFLSQKNTYQINGRPKPLGKILAGPISYCILSDGTFENSFHCDDNYNGDFPIQTISDEDLKNVRYNQRLILKQLQKSGNDMSKLIKEQITALGKALNVSNQSLLLIKLWAILEKVANVTSGTGHEKIYKRLSTLFNNKDIVKEKMEKIAYSRHKTAHGISLDDNIQIALNTLKGYCITILVHLTQIGHNFESCNEWSQYLDCKCMIKDLQNKIIKSQLESKIFKNDKIVQLLIKGK